MKRLIACCVVVALLIVLLLGFMLFFDANQFRPQLEQAMADALGRKVTVGSLKAAVFSGGIAVDDLSIADDPAFGAAPFVTAKSVTVGVDLLPLIFSRKVHVRALTLKDPQVLLLRSVKGEWNFSSLAAATSTSPGTRSRAGTSVLIQKIALAGGRIVVRIAGAGDKERVYDNVKLQVSNVSLTSQFPFRITASTPGRGTVMLDGDAGPIDANDAASTPFHATTEITHLDVKSTGFIDPVSGLSAIVDFRGSLASDGQHLTSKGKVRATGVQLVAGGMPARVPIEMDYESSSSRKAQTGKLTGDVHIGAAASHLSGDYSLAGEVIAVRMNLTGKSMPASDLEAMLPAMGMRLPMGASLKRGTINASLAINGPADRLVIAGPVQASDVLVAGFDVGDKLSTLPSIGGSGSSKTGGTLIESLTAAIRIAPAGIQIAALNVFAPAIGALTGGGTISARGELDFAMRAKLAASSVREVSRIQPAAGIPFRITGTTSEPVFLPDVGRVIGDFIATPKAVDKARDVIGGLFGRKR